MKNTRECAASGRPERAGENRSAASRRPTRAGEKTLKRGSTTSRKPGADIIRANAKKARRDAPRRGARHETRSQNPDEGRMGGHHQLAADCEALPSEATAAPSGRGCIPTVG